MPTRFKDPLVWLHGFIAAFVGGAAGVFADVAADLVVDGTVTLEIKKLGLKALVMGAALAGAYLKRSPLPQIVHEDTEIYGK